MYVEFNKSHSSINTNKRTHFENNLKFRKKSASPDVFDHIYKGYEFNLQI